MDIENKLKFLYEYVVDTIPEGKLKGHMIIQCIEVYEQLVFWEPLVEAGFEIDEASQVHDVDIDMRILDMEDKL